MGKITIVGLGSGSLGQISVETWDKLTQAECLLLCTAKHPIAAELTKRKIAFSAYDTICAEMSAGRAAETIADDVVNKARQSCNVVYAVPDSPLGGDKVIALIGTLAEQSGITVDVCAGLSLVEPLLAVMARLRSPGGCVWDIEQTHETLRRNIIEEVYEVVEAIDLQDAKLLCEELGDLLLQIVFHARIAEEAGAFSMQEVVDGIVEKLIRRHPHVFGDVRVRDAGEVVVNWETIKKQEKAKERKFVLDGVPKDLPALMKAYKLQSKASKVGFDWDNIAPVWDKIREEIAELKEAIQKGDRSRIEAEFGDCLFSFVNLSRFLKLDAEVALNRTNSEFKRRFSYVEGALQRQNKDWQDASLKELDSLWDEAKVLNS